MQSVILLSLYVSLSAAGWGSPARVDVKPAKPAINVLEHMQSLSVKDVDLSDITQNDLEITDCFAEALPIACSSLNVAGNEQERMRLAASMALCELRSSSQNVPRECLDLSNNPASTQSCVAALARSPQQYFAYSGYLQKILPSCLAHSRLLEHDVGQAFYVNTSLAMRDFLQAMQDQNDEGIFKAQEVAEEQAVILRRNADVLKQTQSGIQMMTSLLSKYDVQLQDSMQKQTDLVSDTTDGLAAIPSALEHLLLTLRDQLEEETIKVRSDLASALATILHEHNTVARDNLDNLALTVSTASRSVTDVFYEIQSQALAVESKYRSQLEVISEVESSIVGLRTHSDLVAQHLDVNVKSVLALQDTVDGLEGKLKSLAGDLSGAMDVVADLSRALTFDFKGIASKVYLAGLLFSWWKYGLTQTIIGTLAMLYCRRKMSEQGNLAVIRDQMLPILLVVLGCALAWASHTWHLRKLARRIPNGSVTELQTVTVHKASTNGQGLEKSPHRVKEEDDDVACELGIPAQRSKPIGVRASNRSPAKGR